jgi:hypothetical protein
MRNTVVTMLTASMLVAAVVGMPSSAQSQVVIIIGNGSAQPYYPNPYPYQPRAYAEPTLYGESGYYPEYAENGYAASGYYNGYYRPHRYWGHRYWGYRGW